MGQQKNIIDFPAEDDAQHFRMIDVGRKRVTRRRAIAAGRITVGEAAFIKIREKTLPKGDVLSLAEISGIMGAKKTPELLPMCHPLPLDKVEIHCVLCPPDAVKVYAQVIAHARTGVEMEAIVAAQAALATIWDLVKGTEPNLTIGEVRLLVKEGGKSGLWVNPDGIPDWLAAQLPAQDTLAGVSVGIVVMSDRASAGDYEDKSGPAIAKILQQKGASVSGVRIIPDDVAAIKSAVAAMADENRMIILSGGTGPGPRDVTPETLVDLCDKMIPGFGELLRTDGAQITDMAWLSRSCAGLVGGTLVIAMPGSPKAVREGLEALLPLLPHALKMIEGKGHE